MAQSKDILTVATYNTELSQDVEKIVENILELAKNGVDVFCLQEIVNTPQKESILTTILKQLGHDWQAASHLEKKTLRFNIGSAIVWHTKKLHFEAEKKISLPNRISLSLHEKIFGALVGGATYPLQRRAITCTFLWNHTMISITSFHADHSGGPMHRIGQARHLMSQLPRTAYEVICGDFNTFDLLKTGKEKKLLQQTLSAFIDASEKIPYSADLYNMSLPKARLLKWFIKTFHIHIKRRLDYIWVKNMQVVSCKKVDVAGSDHLPIIAKLTI